jgi:hypothetical protein
MPETSRGEATPLDEQLYEVCRAEQLRRGFGCQTSDARSDDVSRCATEDLRGIEQLL